MTKTNVKSMIGKEKFEDSVDFVSRFYKEGAFKPNRSFGIADKLKRRLAIRWIAASIAGVAFAASAVLIGYHYKAKESVPEPVIITETVKQEATPSPEAIIRLEFNDAPLAEVVKGVEEAYGVKLYNVPKEDLHLTLSYEGNADDFVEAVNELLGINIKIER